MVIAHSKMLNKYTITESLQFSIIVKEVWVLTVLTDLRTSIP